MAKHARRSTFGRNAAIAGATIASITAMSAPAAGANPLGGIQGQLDGIVGEFGSADLLNDFQGAVPFNTQNLVGGADLGAGVKSEGQKVVDVARAQIGTPYVWGGTTPAGFDCSGLTSYAWKQGAGKDIPRTSQAQAGGGISQGALQPGDVVAFYGGATHVGIFSGGNNVIHSPQAGDVVHEASMDYMPFHSATRF